MDFFFCEGCGKRITEHDVKDGAAKDKKLKGVFCKACSAGVSTMEAMPLSDKKARELLAEEKESTPVAPVRKRRRSSLKKIQTPATPSKGKRSGRVTPEHGQTNVPAPSRAPLIWGVGLGGLAFTIALAMLIGNNPTSKNQHSKRAERKPSQRKNANTIPKARLDQATPDVSKSTKPGSTHGGPAPIQLPVPVKALPPSAPESPEFQSVRLKVEQALADKNYKIAWSALSALSEKENGALERSKIRKFIRPLKLMIVTKSKREIQISAALFQNGDLAAAQQRLKEFEQQLGSNLATEAGLTQWAEILKQRQAVEGKGSVQQSTQEAQNAFQKLAMAFEEAVKTHDIKKALTLCQQARSIETLHPHAKQIEAFSEIAGTMNSLITARKEAKKKARKKLIGKSVSVQTIKGPRKGTVIRFENDTMVLEQSFFINGKKQGGATFKIPEKDLTEAQRNTLWPKPDSAKDANAWMATAILDAANDHPAGLKKALDAAETHPLKPYYTKRLATLLKEKEERNAKTFWTQRLLPLANQKAITKPNAREALKAFKTFQASHAKTAYAKSIAQPLKEFHTRLQQALGPPKNLTLDLGDGIKMDFVFIPPGTFVMGLPTDSIERYGKLYRQYDSKPPHKVTLTKGYYIGATEVTRKQYIQIMGAFRKKTTLPLNYPAGGVNFKSAVNFCLQLSKRTSAKTRLPTEAEWEYACRAGSDTLYYFGDDAALGDDTIWMNTDRYQLNPVGKKKPNAFGLFDMCGNAREWCSDFFGAYTNAPTIDPQGPTKGKLRTSRDRPNHRARSYSAFRMSRSANSNTADQGLRVAMDY